MCKQSLRWQGEIFGEWQRNNRGSEWGVKRAVKGEKWSLPSAPAFTGQSTSALKLMIPGQNHAERRPDELAPFCRPSSTTTPSSCRRSQSKRIACACVRVDTEIQFTPIRRPTPLVYLLWPPSNLEEPQLLNKISEENTSGVHWLAAAQWLKSLPKITVY